MVGTGTTRIIFYFCRLVDLPSCYERKLKRFIKCRCIANLDYDLAAGGIGKFFFLCFLFDCRICSTYVFFSVHYVLQDADIRETPHEAL